jgi:tetratricopeptide (TPR) repeat protein
MAEADGIGAAVSADESEENKTEGGVVDAVGLALAMDAAHHDPQLGPAARKYLNRQRALVDLQIKHFDKEHTLAIAAARRKGFIDRMRICLQVLVAAIIGTVVIAIVMLLWDAINDRSVVIDAVLVPEDLAQHGFTGEVVAKRILNRLAEINNTSGTVRAANSYANSLAGDLKLEIPETGVSIGELSRTLHEKLGHLTHVGGEITHSGVNVSVLIRIGDEYQAESTGPEANLAALIQDAATRIYAKTQPYRYGFWLNTNGDPVAARTIFRQLALSGSRIERVWALHGLAIAALSSRESLDYDRQVLEVDPNFFLAHLTRSDALLDSGHDEAGLKESQAVMDAANSGVDSGLSRLGEASIRAQAALNRDELLGDYQNSLTDIGSILEHADSETRSVSAWRSKTRVLTELHDLPAASELFALFPAASNARADAQLSYMKSLLLTEGGDWQAAIPDLQHMTLLIPQLPAGIEQDRGHLFGEPLLAEAYAHTGRDADADAVLNGLPQDAYAVWCTRGRIATLRHDFGGAEKAFAEAVHEAPSLPRAYLDWGEMLAAKGDLPGAITKYTEANQRGPHWADPLKAWGDVLSRQGQSRQALKKYSEALKHAPNWAALKQARDAADKPKA